MSATTLGTDGMTLARKFRRHTRQNGSSQVEEYKGPIARAEELWDSTRDDINRGNATYDDVEYDEGGGIGVIRLITNEVEDPVNEDDGAIWEVDSQELFIDIRRHEYFLGMSSAEELIAVADSYVADADKGPYIADTEASDYDAIMGRYYKLRMAGAEGYYYSVPVLRKTLTLSSRTEIEASWRRVNRATTLGSINPPRKILGALNRMPIVNVTSGVDGTPAALISITYGQWEWLKKAPRILGKAGGKQYELAYEWWGAQAWSTVFYGGTWDPNQD